MSISYLLVVLGLAAFGGAVWALFWAVDDGQYDDLEAQGRAILDEDARRASNDSEHELPVGDVDPAAELEAHLLEFGDLGESQLLVKRNTGVVR